MKKTVLAASVLLALANFAQAADDFDLRHYSEYTGSLDKKVVIRNQEHTFIGKADQETLVINGGISLSGVKGDYPSTTLLLYGKNIIVKSEEDRAIEMKGYVDMDAGNPDFFKDYGANALKDRTLTILGRKDGHAIFMGPSGDNPALDEDPCFDIAADTLTVNGAVELTNGAALSMGWTNLGEAVKRGWVIDLKTEADFDATDQGRQEYEDYLKEYNSYLTMDNSVRKAITVHNKSDKNATVRVETGQLMLAADHVGIFNTETPEKLGEHGTAVVIVGGTYNSSTMGEVKTYASIVADKALNIVGDIKVKAGNGNEESAFVDIRSNGVAVIVGDVIVEGSKAARAGVNIDISGRGSLHIGKFIVRDAAEAAPALFSLRASSTEANGGGEGSVSLRDGAEWNVTETSNITSLYAENGIVRLDPNASLTTKELSGSQKDGLTVVVDLDDAGKTESTFTVESGTYGASVKGAVDKNVDQLKTEESRLALRKQVFGEEKVAFAPLTQSYNTPYWSIREDGVYKEKNNGLQESTMDLAAGTLISLDRILTNDLRKRMGDLRNVTAESGVWARYDGGRLSGKNAFENDFNTIQAGFDTTALLDNIRTGVALSYTKGDADFDRGDADTEAFALAAYGTWFADNGAYVDVIGRVAKADTDMKVEGLKGSLDNMAYSLSGEAGWRFGLPRGTYVEPAVELTYAYIDSDTMKLGDAATYKVDSTQSLVARAGLTAGIQCPNDNGDLYVRVNAAHQFLGDTKLTPVGFDALEVDGKDTWVEFGLGGQWNINDATHVWADVERTSGAKVDEDWRATVGVRYAF